MNIETITLVVAGTLTALLAGLFFGYSVSVNGALHRLKDAEYIRAMQQINIVILNPLFYLSFMGPVFALPLAAFLLRGEPEFWLVLLAAVIYIIGTFGVTMGGNVPMNERMAKVDTTQATDEQIAAARQQFEQPWNRLHNVRTVMAIVATVLIFVACIK